MSLFAGMAAGFGQGQGAYNQKMMDFMNQKSQTMATMYAHLADQAQDPEVASEFTRRAMGWGSANPLMDPKGYKELVRGEKVGLHDIVDQAHQKNVSDYHQSEFGGPTASGAKSNNNPESGFIPGSISGNQNVTNTSQPATTPAPPPTGQGQSAPPPANLMRQMDPMPSNLGGSVALQGQAQAAQPQATPQPIQMAPPPQQAQPQPAPDMDAYVRHGLPPEPPMYGAMGRLNPAWQQWHEIYAKKMEGTVSTPAAMQGYVGAPFMPAGFASPYASMMGREVSAGAKGLSQGFKLVNGQFVPLQPEEYSLAQQLKMGKDAAQTEMFKSIPAFRQAMSQYFMAKTQVIPMEMKVRLAQLGIQQKHLELAELGTNARIFGTDGSGKPIPGALALDDGTGNMMPVGSMWGKNVLPTTATQGKAEMAVPVMTQTNKIAAFASDPNNADLFGKVQGNLENFIAGKFGTGDPREAGLRADLISLASLMVPLHGFRSQKAAEEFMGRLSQGMSPEAFTSALTAFNGVGMQLYQNGMPSLVNASTGSTTRRMPLPPGQKALDNKSTGSNVDKRPAPVTVNQREWDALIAKGHTQAELGKSGIVLGH
jgi:hypothetical protein